LIFATLKKDKLAGAEISLRGDKLLKNCQAQGEGQTKITKLPAEANSMKQERENLKIPQPLEAYLKEIRCLPPLSQEEIDNLYRESILKAREIKEKLNQDPISAQEQEVLERAREAREKVILHNLPLVVFLAKKIRPPSNPQFPDLIQAGNIGLIIAVDKYKPGLGTFSNYACWWIFGKIIKEIAKQGNSFSLSPHSFANLRKIAKYQEGFLNKFGREPSEEEISQGTNLSITTTKNILNLKTARKAVSLDEPVGDRQTPLEELLSDSDFSVEETVINRLMSEESLSKAFSSLTQREAEVLSLQFGRDSLSPKEIRKRLGLSKQRIYKIQKEAFLRLRKHLLRKHLMGNS